MDRNGGRPRHRSSNGDHTGLGVFVPVGFDRMPLDQRTGNKCLGQ